MNQTPDATGTALVPQPPYMARCVLPNTLIMGPLGAGKSHLMRSLRHHATRIDGVMPVDVRRLCYSKPIPGSGGSLQWKMHDSTFRYLRDVSNDSGCSIISVASSQDPKRTVELARESDFYVVFLLPPPDVLRFRRSLKGVSDAKIATATDAYEHWFEMGMKCDAPIVENVSADDFRLTTAVTS